MIQKSTVFVLGAGASRAFGYPSGLELCELLAAPDLQGGRTGPLQTLLQSGYAEPDVRAFAEALRLSGRLSVDAFLEHRSEFLAIGKAAIAAALIPSEDRLKLFQRTNGRQSLYDYIWAKLNAKPEDFHRNQVAFVTFNYDRSLEEYLTIAIQNSYGLTAEDAAHLLTAIPILHVHGTLGAHPAFSKERTRPYQPIADSAALELATRTVRIIHEPEDVSAGFQDARNAMSMCEQVVFLGFGYDPTNLGRLKVREIPQRVANYGTSLGLTQLERSAVAQAFDHRITLGAEDEDALGFLRRAVPLQ